MKNLYTKYLLMMFLSLLLCKTSYAQNVNPDGTPWDSSRVNPLETTAVNCGNNNGIAITVNATFMNSGPYSPINSMTNCLPNAMYNGNGAWTGNGNGNGFITYSFAQPVISSTITYSAVNGPNGSGTDIGQISIDGGGILTLSNPCGVNIAGNVLTCTLNGGQGNNPYGDISITVSSTCPFTTITLTNIGAQSGWVQGNLCNFLWSPVCSITAPLLSSNSISNICPNVFADLTTITALNQSNCYNLTWHTGTPASNLNLVGTPNNVVAGTYYASFFNQLANCYSVTTPVIVTINECCQPTLVLTAADNMTNLSPVTVKHRERSNWITASNIIGIGDNVFQNGVVYHAGNFVELLTGFEAVNGSQFAAYIEGCSNSFVYKDQSSSDIIGDNPKPDLSKKLNSFAIVPNPSNSFIEIGMQNEQFNKIIITSIDGKKVFEKDIDLNNSYNVDVSDFSNGIYIVNVFSVSGQQFSQKLIKN